MKVQFCCQLTFQIPQPFITAFSWQLFCACTGILDCGPCYFNDFAIYSKKCMEITYFIVVTINLQSKVVDGF